MNRFSYNKEIKDYIHILIGGILLAIGATLLFIPNQIAPGGTPGIATLINHVISYPIGMIMFCINTPLVLLSMKYISKKFAIKTIFSITVSSFSVDFINEFLKIEPFTSNSILASIFGGIIIGVGLGFIIEGNAAAGGPAIIAKMLSDRTKYKQENLIVLLDSVIVVSAGFVFNNMESTLWSLIGVYMTFKGMDAIVSGRQIYKSVHISTDNIEVLSENIYKAFGKDGILIKGEGLNLKEDKKILMFIISSDKMTQLQEIVKSHDKRSLLIINDASEYIISDA